MTVPPILRISTGNQANVTLGERLAIIAGFVTDKNKNGLPGARVTLWATRYDQATGQYVNTNVAAVKDNPQTANTDGMIDALGTYRFLDVPAGIYNLTVEFDGNMAYGIANATVGTLTLNVAITDYEAPNMPPKTNASDEPVNVSVQTNVITAEELDRLRPEANNVSSPYCTIFGLVTDKYGHGIPNASVTLWEGHMVDGRFINDRLAGISGISDNPQASNSNSVVAQIGIYTYYYVPYGQYNVTAEKVDSAGVSHLWFTIVNATSGGTHRADVAIPDYIIAG